MGSLPNLNDLDREKRRINVKHILARREIELPEQHKLNRRNTKIQTISHVQNFSLPSLIQTRIRRISAHNPHQVQSSFATVNRRRESINSSIGANSVRRLITLNNRNSCNKVAPDLQKLACKNFIYLAISHGLMCAILIPLMGLQASNSIWHHNEQWINLGPNIGSMLFSLSFFISAGMCFPTTRLIKKYGFTILIASGYLAILFFLFCHFYPSIFTFIPAYLLLGVSLGPAWVAKFALVVLLASKLGCNQFESNLNVPPDILDEHNVFCGRDKKIRRLARWFQIAQDMGIIIGSIIASIILACSATDSNCFTIKVDDISKVTMTNNSNLYIIDGSKLKNFNTIKLPILTDETYNHNERGKRICGSNLCPVWNVVEANIVNTSSLDDFITTESENEGTALIAIYIFFGIIALSLTFLSGRINSAFRNERVRGMTDTLLFAGPMVYFIGTEQAYMLADFTRAYISCSLISRHLISSALVGMGIMQLIVSSTLSMLLRHTKRIAVIVAGFFFHACLLLVLSRWKPSKDDSALFYVIAAAWGACNAMWETLVFALVTITHPNNVAEVLSPLQALRFLGLGITFAAHGLLCENQKILILVVVLIFTVPLYATLEIRLEIQRKAQASSL